MTKKDPNKTITHVVYALQALTFIFIFTSIAALILNYLKRNEVKGTWLESHFRWQIRTFWWTLLWSAVGLGFFLGFVLLADMNSHISGLFIASGYFTWACTTIWYIYRIVKGWLRLNDERGMYFNRMNKKRLHDKNPVSSTS